MQIMKKKLVISLLLTLALSLGLYSQILNDWRSIDRDGIYQEEKNLLKSWPSDGPELLWVNDSLLPGHSSAAIAHNTIYTTGMDDSVDVVIALDMKGNIKWKTVYGLSWSKSYRDSRCTPIIEDKRLYVTSGLGEIACIDAITGNISWKLYAHDKFNGIYHKWGISESPLIFENKIFYTPGGEQTMMVALDKMTGETIWQTESLDDKPSYTSPLLIERNGYKYIVQVSTNYIFCVNPENGNILWKFNYGQFAGGDWRANILINTPLYHNNELFVTAGYDHKAVMLELFPPEDSMSVFFKWADTVLDVHHGGVVKLGDYIYGANWINNGNGNWVCLDWNTGKKMYETKWENKGSIIAADGMLYCYEEKRGNIALVEPTPEKFKIAGTFKVPYGKGPHWSHLVVKDGILYVRHGEALMAYDIKAE